MSSPAVRLLASKLARSPDPIAKPTYRSSAGFGGPIQKAAGGVMNPAGLKQSPIAPRGNPFHSKPYLQVVKQPGYGDGILSPAEQKALRRG